MVSSIGGTKIPRLYQCSPPVCLSSRLVPGFPDCTYAWQHSWYQDSPIVPTLLAPTFPDCTYGNTLGTRIPRLYQSWLPMLVPGFPDCTNARQQCDNDGDDDDGNGSGTGHGHGDDDDADDWPTIFV